MITLNGCKFAESPEEAFAAQIRGEIVFGMAKRRIRRVDLFDMDQTPIATITNNGVLARATKLESGEIWYSYGDPDGIGRYGRFGQMVDEIEGLAKGKDARGLFFTEPESAANDQEAISSLTG